VAIENLSAALAAAKRQLDDAELTRIIEDMVSRPPLPSHRRSPARHSREPWWQGLGDGSSGLRFHEFLTLVEGTERQPVQQTSVEDDDALNSSFQWLGGRHRAPPPSPPQPAARGPFPTRRAGGAAGNLEDPESSVDKSRIAEVLKDFELSADVDEVLGAPATAGSPDRVLKQNLSLTDFKQVGARRAPRPPRRARPGDARAAWRPDGVVCVAFCPLAGLLGRARVAVRRRGWVPQARSAVQELGVAVLARRRQMTLHAPRRSSLHSRSAAKRAKCGPSLFILSVTVLDAPHRFPPLPAVNLLVSTY
jgi:hypothetical protein